MKPTKAAIVIVQRFFDSKSFLGKALSPTQINEEAFRIAFLRIWKPVGEFDNSKPGEQKIHLHVLIRNGT